MKKNLLLSFFLMINMIAFGQQETENGYYLLRKRFANQDTVYIKAKDVRTTLKKGWIITETVGENQIQRVIAKDTIVKLMKDTSIQVLTNWKIGEVKHTDDHPDKLILNPYYFTNPKDSILNNISYLKIPGNGYVTLLRSFYKWNAITIPFAVRPSLNDTIGSKVTTDLKIGASFSYNRNLEIFKNRRIKAKKSIYGLGIGLGFGFSKVTLNAASTSLLKTPYKVEEDGLAFFLAPGLGINMKGFQVNFSYGWDLPVTSNVKDWNYSKKGYWGIGLGVGLDVFGKI